MSKARQKNRKTKKPAPQTAPPRRNFLKMLRNGAIAAGVISAGGAYGVYAVRSTLAEQDLSPLGNGTPMIVQIHDPSCVRCRTLMRATRRALKQFDEDQITYRVANITLPEGQNFASRYGVGHVTLLLFNGKGELIDRVHGEHSKSQLVEIFKANLI